MDSAFSHAQFWCRIGRVGVSILTRAMDIVLMIVLAYLPPQGGTWALTALIGSHLLRKAVANCTRPLLRRCADCPSSLRSLG